MGLEVGTYISDLNSANPPGGDAKNQGDDHLRLLKSTIKTTFPNVAGAMTATHTELNYVVGVTSAIQGQLNLKGFIAGQVWTGTHDFTAATTTALTQAVGTSNTTLATTAFAAALAFATALPAQAGAAGKFTFTNGTSASWVFITNTFNIIKDSLATTYTYTGSNITSITETINGLSKATTVTYNADGTVNVVTTTYAGKTRTETYTYTAGKITSLAVTEI